jgi:hypothetical protein
MSVVKTLPSGRGALGVMRSFDPSRFTVAAAPLMSTLATSRPNKSKPKLLRFSVGVAVMVS